MFNIFKRDPVKKLENKYNEMMTKAVDAQRNRNIELYSELSFEADKILKDIEKLKKVNE
jgi:hypothetical protein